jgi:leucyl-tRNA synthetase
MHTTKPICKKALAYWESVDLYIGGSEHATSYCILVLEQILKDKGLHPTEEPFKKLINQG